MEVSPGHENNSCWERVGQAESVEKINEKHEKLQSYQNSQKQQIGEEGDIFRNLANFAGFHVFHDFQLIPPVLLFPTNYCLLNQVIPPLSGVLGNTSRPLNIDIMYSEVRSEMQDCLFSNLGIVGNMKPTYIS